MQHSLARFAAIPAAFVIILAATPGSSVTSRAGDPEPSDVAAFRATAGGHVASVIVELRPAPGQVLPPKSACVVERMALQAQARRAQQNAFIAALPARGIRILPAQVDAPQADGTVRT